MSKKLVLLFAITALTVFLAVQVFGEAPQLISYQGMLKDAAGDPVNGLFGFIVAIYDDSISTDPSRMLWQETHLGVNIVDGLFTLVLGQGQPPTPISESIFAGPNLWFGVRVQGGDELAPRTRLISVPYSQRVKTVDAALGGAISGNVDIGGDLNAAGKAKIGPNVTNTGLNAFAVGENVSADGDNSNVAGGINNVASGGFATIGGGRSNTASGQGAVVAGGYAGIASNENSTIGGGWHNVSSGSVSTVAGGQEDTASETYSTVSGGQGNAASGWVSTVGGGQSNKARGAYSTVPGGSGNLALGSASLAAGNGAVAGHNNSFVWSDAPGGGATTADNQFIIRASGGVGINTNAPTTALQVDGEAKSVVSGVEFYMVPRGAIIMWSGLLSDIPAGWTLCDGTNGTPDLRNRFISSCAPGENPGGSGGSDQHNHWVDLPSGYTGTGTTTYQDVSAIIPTLTASLASHTHFFDPPGGYSNLSSNIPPYYKLAFIMKL